MQAGVAALLIMQAALEMVVKVAAAQEVITVEEREQDVTVLPILEVAEVAAIPEQVAQEVRE
jgi:hypothetical protein